MTSKRTLFALLFASFGLAGCQATVVNPGPSFGPNFGGGRTPVSSFAERGFQDGLSGRPWLCERDPRACGARAHDPQSALRAYQDGWREGWRRRCAGDVRGRDAQRACREFIDREHDDHDRRRDDDFFRFGR
ncbi:hypothetical protein [Neomegalonema perideroedes]|uniref:hypothetical protein n=1 Tax=Neomegalonema perideroedes TaxID=217219 RepID=UPI00036F5E81|nr:hypothetical protein [Neomegalonema perideroedes]